MTFLLFAVACLVSKAEEPLPLSGKFNTIELASKSLALTAENSQVRMLMREVNFYNQYKVMSMTFYVRKNGKCQLHTVWADKSKLKFCSSSWSILQQNCPERKGTDSIPGIWRSHDTVSTFPNMYSHPAPQRGLTRNPTDLNIVIYFASNSTILFEARFFDKARYFKRLAGALANGKNLTEEMQEKFVNLTKQLKIPTENIENIYERDACPKWKP